MAKFYELFVDGSFFSVGRGQQISNMSALNVSLLPNNLLYKILYCTFLGRDTINFPWGKKRYLPIMISWYHDIICITTLWNIVRGYKGNFFFCHFWKICTIMNFSLSVYAKELKLNLVHEFGIKKKYKFNQCAGCRADPFRWNSTVTLEPIQ